MQQQATWPVDTRVWVGWGKRAIAMMALGLGWGLLGEGAIALPSNPHPAALTIASHTGRPLLRPPEAPAPNTTEGCVALTVMANLAYMDDPYSDLTDEVAGRQVAWCYGRAAEEPGIPQWSNRQPMRLGSNWYYPRGTSAQFGENWNYPNGRAAIFGGSWYYPNGQNARFASFWYAPDGRVMTPESLLGEACEQVGDRRCRARLAEVSGASSFWYELALIQLAWLGYQIDQGVIDAD